MHPPPVLSVTLSAIPVMTFQSVYPLQYYLEDAPPYRPPLVEKEPVKPHIDSEEFLEPPPYPPTSQFPTVHHPRVNVLNPPYECYFVV